MASDELLPDGAARFDGGDIPARLESLARLSEVGIRTADDDEAFGGMAQAVNEVLRGVGGYLHLFVDGKATLRRFGPVPELSEWAVDLPVGVGRTKWLMETREPIIMDYTHPHVIDRIPPDVVENGFLSAVSLPLCAGEETLGICSVVYDRRVAWPPEDVLFLKQVGRVAGSVISRIIQSSKAVELSVLGERKRLSSEIHDNVSHLLGSLSLCSASILASRDEGDMESVDRGLEKMEDICGKTMRVFRGEMLSLRAPAERTDEWMDALRGILDTFQSAWGIKTSLVQKVRNQPLSLNVQVAMQLTRILNECLSNILKHAQAANVTVSLYEDGQDFGMVIADDGHGFDVDNVAPERLGIKIMKERTRAMGGKLSIRSNAHGTVVKVDVPRVGKL